MTQDEAVQMMQLGNALGSLIKPEAFVRWLNLSIPKLHNATPWQYIQSGDFEAVMAVAEGYKHPSYT